MSNVDALKDIQEKLRDTEPSKGFTEVPDGTYNAVLASCEVTQSRENKTMLVTKFTLVDGEYADVPINVYTVVEGTAKAVETAWSIFLSMAGKLLSLPTEEIKDFASNAKDLFEDFAELVNDQEGLTVVLRRFTTRRGDKSFTNTQVVDVVEG